MHREEAQGNITTQNLGALRKSCKILAREALIADGQYVVGVCVCVCVCVRVCCVCVYVCYLLERR